MDEPIDMQFGPRNLVSDEGPDLPHEKGTFAGRHVCCAAKGSFIS